MIEIRSGSWISVAWGTGDQADGTSLYVEICCQASDASQSISEVRGFARWFEEELRTRFDHQAIDPEIPDIRAFTRRIGRHFEPEVKHFHLRLRSLMVREENLWDLLVRFDGP